MADQPQHDLQLSVVSGTYNRIDHLKRMVESVRQSVLDLTYEIILVDGGSEDGTIEWCKEQDDVVLIEQGELLGAIPAFNEGACAACGEVVAFLNDDIEVYEDTLHRAYDYLQRNPHVGQVALENDVRGTADKFRRPVSKAYGYVYGQCSVTPKWLGDLVGWWGDEGMRTYGGDTRFSLALWELGYKTVPVEGCKIIDHVVEDELREVNNAEHRGPGKGHPDTDRFQEVWRGRLPYPNEWIEATIHPVLEKAKNRTLRTLRFKGMMDPNHTPRTALVEAFGEFGPTKQVNTPATLGRVGGRNQFQQFVFQTIKEWQPDLVLFQAQRDNNVTPETVHRIRRQMPNTFLVNWDGDTHYPMTKFHSRIAKAVHLQLTISPDLFSWYTNRGVYNIGYWPIGIENQYIENCSRDPNQYDVLFLGSLYGEGVFPEAEMRRDAVIALHHSDLVFEVFGAGWQKVGINTKRTLEEHTHNAQLYCRSKMSLSISQASDLWGYSSDRLYNITATGCPALVQRFKGMEEHGYIDGETCVAWDTIPEMLDKAKYYLKHRKEREEIGRRGREMTLKRHTWPKRLEGFFAMLEELTWALD